MFSRIATLLIIALSLLAAASAVPRTNEPAGQCNTGSLQCCNSFKQATGGLIGSITGLVGTDCSPINALSISETSCKTQPVCCNNNNINGVVVLACNPISL